MACYALGPLAVGVDAAGGFAALASTAVPTVLGGFLSLVVFLLGSLLLVLGCWFDVTENEGLFDAVGPVQVVGGEGAVDRLPVETSRSDDRGRAACTRRVGLSAPVGGDTISINSITLEMNRSVKMH